MKFKTHQVAGMIAAEAALMIWKEPFGWGDPVALFGGYVLSTISDLDKEESYDGREFFIISWLFRRFHVQHRTVTHSILFYAQIWLALSSIHGMLQGILHTPIPFCLVWAWTFGVASHAAVDLLNPQGVAIFWPLRYRIHLLPEIVAIPVDSITETLFRTMLKVIFAFLLLVRAHAFLQSIPVVGHLFEPIWHALYRVMPAFAQTWMN